MTVPQSSLFQPDQPCPVPGCGAIRTPNQTTVPTCQHDLEPPDNRPYRRPRGCLNRAVPNELPEDF